MNDQQQILSSTEEQLQEWKKYIESIFVENRNFSHNIIDITNAELIHAILGAKNGKTPGPDGIQREVLKNWKNIRLSHF